MPTPQPRHARKQPLFSLIMPVYGVERYIADAVADVLTQTCADFELIVVDDCTPDRSIDIVKDLAAHDMRVRVVSHNRNEGVAQARNSGIDAARGRWLLFPDPDDRYDASLLETVRGAIARHDPDLVVFGHVQEYYDSNGTHLYDNPIHLADGIYPRGPSLGRAALALEQQTHLGYPWNKAYRADLVKGAHLRFEDEPLIEDILFNVAFLRQARTVVTTGAAPYRYAKRLDANLTNKFVSDYFKLHRRRIREIRDFIDESGALDDDARATLGALYARFIFSSLEQNTDARAGMNHRQRTRWLKRLFAEDLFNELIPLARADGSASLAACLELLKARNVFALLALGRVIHVVRTHSAVIYTKVKSGR